MIAFRKIISVIVFTLLAGCASKGYKISIDKEFLESKSSVNLGTFMAQKEIDARMPISTTGSAVGMQFGLIGAIIGSAIDSSNNKDNLTNKETQVASLRDALLDFDITNTYHLKTTKLIKTLDWLNIDKVTNISDFTKIKFEEDQYFLKLDSSYTLTKQFDSLEFYTNATLFKIEKTSSSKISKNKKHTETVLFRNLYKYISPESPILKRSSQEMDLARKNIKLWFKSEVKKTAELTGREKKNKIRTLNREKKNKLKAEAAPYSLAAKNIVMSKFFAENEGDLIKQYLNQALVETSKMIIFDMNDIKPITEYKKDKSIALYKKGLQIINKDNDRVIVRDIESYMAGQICSMPMSVDYTRCTFAR